MGKITGNFLKMVFKRNIRKDLQKISLDSQMVEVLTLLDGSRSVATIAELLRWNITELRTVLDKLFKNKLIYPIEKSLPMPAKEFLLDLKKHLAAAIGPISGMLIKDSLRTLGINPTQISHKGAEKLVELISSKIPIEDKRETFKMMMMSKLGK